MITNKERFEGMAPDDIKVISEFDASEVPFPEVQPMSDIGMLRMIRDMIVDHQKDESFFERSVALYLIASFAEEEILSLSSKRR